MRILSNGVVCAVLFGATVARADVMQADGISASLELPKGFCALTREDPVEKQHYEIQDRMQVSNGVMLFAVPCPQMESTRKGDPLKKWAIWLINGPKGNHTKIPAEMSREALIEELTKGVPGIDIEKISNETGDRAAKEGIGVALKEMKVIANDKSVMYTGQVASLEADGVKRELAVVTGWASMSGRLFTFNIYSDLEGQQTFDTLLSEARDTIARSVSITDTMAPPK
jgi:hypothetical protein